MNIKKYLSVIIVFFAIYIPGSAFADSGICGDNMQWYLDEQGNLTITGTDSMYDYHIGNNTDGLSEPPWYTNANSIKNIIISDGVKKLGSSAFALCKNVESVILPDSITQLGDGLFNNCKNLQSISLPDNIETIPVSAFAGCVSLKKVKMPGNLRKIEVNAFADSGVEELEIPESVNEIEHGAFWMSKIKQIKIPDNISNIPTISFEDAKDLQTVQFPKNLKTIDELAFHNCVSMCEIYLPDGLETIEQYAFLGCTSIEKIYIPDSVTHIGFDAFFAGTQGIRTSNPTIYCYKGSAAEKYAKEENFEFVIVTESMYKPEADLHEISSVYKPTIVVKKIINNNINISIGTSNINFNDAAPFIDSNNCIQIPVRAVSETMGATVSWYGENQTVIIEKNKIKIEIPIGSPTVTILKDNQEIQMCITSFIKNDRSFIPLQFLAEVFCYDITKIDDYDVIWN